MRGPADGVGELASLVVADLCNRPMHSIPTVSSILADFRGLVLGCIEANIRKPNTRWSKDRVRKRDVEKGDMEEKMSETEK